LKNGNSTLNAITATKFWNLQRPAVTSWPELN